MNYVITGSIGHISKPLAAQLAAAGHSVTVITSNSSKKHAIETLGAQAAIGSVTDRTFLSSAFTGADAIYLMVPGNFAAPDLLAYQKEVSNNYIAALKASGVKHVVLLSSIGSHLRHGAGPIDGLGYLEEELSRLDIHVKILRPSYFFYNLHSMGGMLRNAGIMGSNFGGTDHPIALTHTDDIAAVAAKHLLKLDFKGQTVEYIVSDERSSADIARVLGAAVGKPQTPWIQFSDEDAYNGMLQAGLSEDIAGRYVEMGRAFREGRATEHYVQHKPAFGKVKLEDFAEEFKAAYAQG
jgi:uncharacterized protein YbjT (DUF2867 family)